MVACLVVSLVAGVIAIRNLRRAQRNLDQAKEYLDRLMGRK